MRGVDDVDDGVAEEPKDRPGVDKGELLGSVEYPVVRMLSAGGL